MSVLTEAQLRQRLRGEDLDALEQFRVEPGAIVTPSARAFLSDHKIRLVQGKDGNDPHAQTQKSETRAETNGNLPEFHQPARYESMGGGFFDEKPEHMTSLRGNLLVNKDHPAIRFRGGMDSLEARTVQTQLRLAQLGLNRASEDLDEVLAFLREILRCEVLDQPLEDRSLLGMSEEELRSRSHTPKKYYGLAHFAAGAEHGEAVALLNLLRTQAREVELSAYALFKDAYGVPRREDILRALNRLSSLFYVMMFRVRAGEYGQPRRG